MSSPAAAAHRPVQQAILSRRSIRRFAAQPVERAVVRRLLDAAVQAPNHRLTRPWRFFVLDQGGPARAELTRIAEKIALHAMPEPHDAAAVDRARTRAEDIAAVPVLILAYSIAGRDEHETRENYAAVACALQNAQLAAFEEGLASGWSTGGMVRDAEMRACIGAEAEWEFVGALYIGYPQDSSAPAVTRERPGADEYTRWLAD